MRKLLNTLFVINEDAYLTLDGENLVVTRNKQETHRYALHTLEGIVCFTYAGASPALMGACARRGIDLCFFDPYGSRMQSAGCQTFADSHQYSSYTSGVNPFRVSQVIL